MRFLKATATLVCFVMLLSFMTGCGTKKPQTVSGFTKVMEETDFEVQDVTATTITNGRANAVIIAVCDDYQIEFFELIDSETGEDVFNNNKQIFNDKNSVRTNTTEITSSNYNYYAFNADGDFHMIARIENTFIYCVTDKKYKDEILDLVKELGYK